MTEVRISVDQEVCASAGTCAFTVPAVFDQDDEDGRVVVLREEVVGGGLAEDVRTAIMLCPSGAIREAEEG
ncbi:ferredoxin [Salininema proteolyticum]|uniref:Ferredoxin n=1 Tax=Salininema proteolyticum TaxID=1607685 RepID=A0ABV8U122_9ACTN